MVNIYLFIELLGSADASATVDALKALSLDNCKFANVVMLSDEKLVAQLDCKDSTDGDKAILTNNRQGRRRGADQHHRRGPPPQGLVISHGRRGPRRLRAARNARSRRSCRPAPRHAR